MTTPVRAVAVHAINCLILQNFAQVEFIYPTKVVGEISAEDDDKITELSDILGDNMGVYMQLVKYIREVIKPTHDELVVAMMQFERINGNANRIDGTWLDVFKNEFGADSEKLAADMDAVEARLSFVRMFGNPEQ